MPKLTGEEEVFKALNQLERKAGQQIRKVFGTKAYLDRIGNAKLVLLSFVTKQSRSSIIDKITRQHIQEFERKNGELEILALEIIENSKCSLCHGNGELIDKTVHTNKGFPKAPCPKCGGNQNDQEMPSSTT